MKKAGPGPPGAAASRRERERERGRERERERRREGAPRESGVSDLWVGIRGWDCARGIFPFLHFPRDPSKF